MAVLRLAKPIDFYIDFYFSLHKKKGKEKNILHSTQDLWTVFSERQINKLCACMWWWWRELGNTEWKGERHKSVRKMMNGGRRQRFEGCMHWQSLEAAPL